MQPRVSRKIYIHPVYREQVDTDQLAEALYLLVADLVRETNSDAEPEGGDDHRDQEAA